MLRVLRGLVVGRLASGLACLGLCVGWLIGLLRVMRRLAGPRTLGNLNANLLPLFCAKVVPIFFEKWGPFSGPCFGHAAVTYSRSPVFFRENRGQFWPREIEAFFCIFWVFFCPGREGSAASGSAKVSPGASPGASPEASPGSFPRTCSSSQQQPAAASSSGQQQPERSQLAGVSHRQSAATSRQ